MASSHILQIFLRVTVQNQIRIAQWVSSSTQPVSMLNLQILSSYFMFDFCDTSLLIRFWTHRGLERAGIVISEENKKSEPFSYREKVRIFCFNGSPPGRRSYGSRNRALTKAPLGLLLPRLRWGRAVQVLLSAVIAKGKMSYKTKKTATKSCLPCGAGKQSKSEPFPFDAASAASSNVMVCVPSL